MMISLAEFGDEDEPMAVAPPAAASGTGHRSAQRARAESQVAAAEAAAKRASSQKLYKMTAAALL